MHSFLDPPRVTTHPQATTILEGKPLNLTCLATGKPEPIITWYKDGLVIKDRSNGIFVITKIKRRDDGIYQCYAKNKVGTDRSLTAKVQVNCKCARHICIYTITYWTKYCFS